MSPSICFYVVFYSSSVLFFAFKIFWSNICPLIDSVTTFHGNGCNYARFVKIIVEILTLDHLRYRLGRSYQFSNAGCLSWRLRYRKFPYISNILIPMSKGIKFVSSSFFLDLKFLKRYSASFSTISTNFSIIFQTLSLSRSRSSYLFYPSTISLN